MVAIVDFYYVTDRSRGYTREAAIRPQKGATVQLCGIPPNFSPMPESVVRDDFLIEKLIDRHRD
jgi:hypothetical protein